MKPDTITIIEENIPGTSRQRVRSGSGMILDRQNVYLKPEAWEILAEISEEQGVSGSIVIARLIFRASKDIRQRRQANK